MGLFHSIGYHLAETRTIPDIAMDFPAKFPDETEAILDEVARFRCVHPTSMIRLHRSLRIIPEAFGGWVVAIRISREHGSITEFDLRFRSPLWFAGNRSPRSSGAEEWSLAAPNDSSRRRFRNSGSK